MSTRYWIGGTNNWSNPGSWSATSGGITDNTIPTSADDVHFDAGSNASNAAYTVTIDVTANCKDLMFDAKPGDGLNGTITLAGTAALNVYGSLSFLSGMTRTYTGALTFASAGVGNIITYNAVTTASVITFSGVGDYTLQDALDNGAGTITHTAGTLNTNGKAVTTTVGFASTGTTTRTLSLGASAFSVGTWTISGTGITFNCGTSIITTTSSSWPTFIGGDQTYYDLVAGTANQAFKVQGNNTFNNFTKVNTAWANATISFGGNITVNGTFTLRGSAPNAIQIISRDGPSGTGDQHGSTIVRTITLNGPTDIANIHPRGNLNFVGPGAPFPTSFCSDDGGNTGLLFETPLTLYWYSATTGTKEWNDAANWFLGSGGTGGAGRVPLGQDNVVFDSASIGAAGTTINLGGVTTAYGLCNAFTVANPIPFAFSDAVIFMHGNISLSAGALTAVPRWWIMSFGRDNIEIDVGGHTLLEFRAYGYNTPSSTTVHLRSAMTCTSYGIFMGNINDNGYSLTCGRLYIGPSGYGANAVINKSGTWTVTSAAGAICLYRSPAAIPGSNTLTLNDTGTLRFTDATASTKILDLDDEPLTFNNIELAGAGSGAYHFLGNSTFNNFKISGGAKTIKFTEGTNTTVASMTGFEDNVVTFNTVSGASTFTLTKSGGGVVSMRGANITNSIASPASTFYAGSSGVNGGGNTNWTFANGSVQIASTMQIGALNSLLQPNALKKNIYTWTTALTDAQLITVTTP